MKKNNNLMKIDFLWCSPHPNHYHQFLINCMKEASISVDEVYFQKKISKYPWNSNFTNSNSYYLRKLFFNIDFPFLRTTKIDRYNYIVVAGWSEPTMILMLSWMALRKMDYILYSDTPKDLKRTGIKQFFRKKWLSYILNKSKYIFTTGTPGIEAFRRMGIGDDKIFNFPFLTDLNMFSFNNRNINIDIPLIFSSGRLDNKHKGYDVALLALINLKNSGIKFKFEIAGEGPDRAIIEETIASLGLDDDVRLLGWLEPLELLGRYHEADLFLHSSRFDPFPNAVLEAMACGLPVICSDQAGSGIERIVNNYNGWLFQSENIDDLYIKLKDALDLKSIELRQIGKNARLTAEKWSYLYNINILKKILQHKVN